MIELTRLGKRETFYLNPDLIERIDAHVDTVVRLTNGIEYVVVEGPGEIVERIIAYRRLVGSTGPVVVTKSALHDLGVPEPARGDAADGRSDDNHATVVELPANREVPR